MVTCSRCGIELFNQNEYTRESNEVLCIPCSNSDEKIYTSLAANLKYINPNLDEYIQKKHPGWTLYRLEEDNKIHYFFSLGNPSVNATPCDIPGGFTICMDRDGGQIPYLVRTIKKDSKLSKWLKR